MRRSARDSFHHLSDLVDFLVPRIKNIYEVVIVGMVVVMFTDSSILGILLLATLESRKYLTLDLLPVLIVLVCFNIIGILAFCTILFRASTFIGKKL